MTHASSQLPSPTELQKYQDFSSFLIPTFFTLGADLRTAMPLPLQSEPTNSTCFTQWSVPHSTSESQDSRLIPVSCFSRFVDYQEITAVWRLSTHHGLYNRGFMQRISIPPLSEGVVLPGPVSEVILVTVLATMQNNAICPVQPILFHSHYRFSGQKTQLRPVPRIHRN